MAFFDFPGGASPEYGIYVALAAATTVMSAAGDYSTLRGAPAFPSLRETRLEPPPSHSLSPGCETSRA